MFFFSPHFYFFLSTNTIYRPAVLEAHPIAFGKNFNSDFSFPLKQKGDRKTKVIKEIKNVVVWILQVLLCHYGQGFGWRRSHCFGRDWSLMLLKEVQLFIYIYKVQKEKHFIGLTLSQPNLAEWKLSHSILTLFAAQCSMVLWFFS